MAVSWRVAAHLDDISAKRVRVNVRVLDLGPLRAESELLGLEHQVGVLTTGHWKEKEKEQDKNFSRLGHLISWETGKTVHVLS